MAGDRLAETWRLTELDRVAVNTVVERITVFSNGAIEISYKGFSFSPTWALIS